MKTHISMNAILYRIAGLIPDTSNMVFIGFGHHVNPKGSYIDAPIVALYQDATGKFWGKK